MKIFLKPGYFTQKSRVQIFWKARNIWQRWFWRTAAPLGGTQLSGSSRLPRPHPAHFTHLYHLPQPCGHFWFLAQDFRLQLLLFCHQLLRGLAKSFNRTGMYFSHLQIEKGNFASLEGAFLPFPLVILRTLDQRAWYVSRHLKRKEGGLFQGWQRKTCRPSAGNWKPGAITSGACTVGPKGAQDRKSN